MSKAPRLENLTRADLIYHAAGREEAHDKAVLSSLREIHDDVANCNNAISLLKVQLSNDAAEQHRETLLEPTRATVQSPSICLAAMLFWFLVGTFIGFYLESLL